MYVYMDIILTNMQTPDATRQTPTANSAENQPSTVRPHFFERHHLVMLVTPIALAACFGLQTSKRGSSTQLLSQPHSECHESRRRFLGVFVLVNHCTVTNALTPEEASVAYDSYAEKYDILDGGKASSVLGLDDARTSLFRKAKGRVLEIGVGTGLNLSKYDTSQVSSLTVVDVAEGMLKEARTRAAALDLAIPVEFVKADATSELIRLFGADSFDTVVDSFSLCVMGDEGARQCLKQMAAVVKPSIGRLLLLENSRSSSQALGWYQDLTASVAASVGGKGCVYNQDVTSMILATEHLEIENMKSFLSGLFRSYECVKPSN